MTAKRKPKQLYYLCDQCGARCFKLGEPVAGSKAGDGVVICVDCTADFVVSMSHRGSRAEEEERMRGLERQCDELRVQLAGAWEQRDAALAKANPPAPVAREPGAPMTEADLVDGGYYVQRGGVVRVRRVDRAGWWIDYVQILDSGEVIAGGSSSWLDLANLAPITDPVQLAAARLFESRRLEKAAEAAANRARADSLRWSGVLEVLHEARKNAGPKP